MEVPVTVAVEVPLIGDERRKNWAKVVTNVDDSLATGWAYDGDFVATGPCAAMDRVASNR